ncbi:MAG: TSUP family transporter, partial [Acidiferrobacterales bacterium]
MSLLESLLVLEVFADPRWFWVAAAAVLAALLRGFTGFGAAMVFVPVASAIYEPKVAVVVLFIVDGVITFPLVFKAIHQCRWPDVTCLAVGAALTIPLGVYVLLITDVELLRWFISFSILGLVAALASGWRYKKRPPQMACFGVGGVSGFAGGVANLYGPPLVLFWLGGQSGAATVRANIIVFFAITAVVSGITYWWNGLLSAHTLSVSIGLMPLYAAAVWLGA